MNRAAGGLLVAAGAAARAGAAKLLTSRVLGGVPGDAAPRNRWLAVTVNYPPERLRGSELPEPVAKLTDQAEVRVQPAPGGRGIELAMRRLEPPAGGLPGLAARLGGADPRQQLRTALRDAKSLIETGEVIRPDEPATHPTRTGRLMDFAIGRAAEEGRL